MSDKEIKFGTDGWRGIVADDFTFDSVARVTRAIGEYVRKNGKNDKLVIGYDARFLGKEFADCAAQILGSLGVKPYMFDRPMPTPMTAFAIKRLDTAGAVMFTASHNPPEYQGIKFIAEYAGPADTSITEAIEHELESEAGPEAYDKPAGETVSITGDYWDHLGDLVDMELIADSDLRIVIDPMRGAAAGLLSERLGRLSESVMALNDFFDPSFGGRNPDPSEKSLENLAADVVASGADIGLALDGDGDRFGIIDGLGVYLSPNQVISLLSYYLLADRGQRGQLARTVATTHLIDDIAGGFGVEVIETPVGFKWICREMLRRDVLIGGEESGGLSVKGHIPEKDGILACMLAAEMTAAYDKKPLSKILDDLHREFGDRFGIRMDLHLDRERKNSVLEKFRETPPDEIAGVPVIEVRDIDGVKLVLENGDWLLIRPSGTEPLVRVYIEAKTSARFFDLEDFAQKSVK